MTLNIGRRIWWISLVIISGSLLVVSLRGLESSHQLIGHFLLFILYLVALGYFVDNPPSKLRAAGILCFISFVPQLIVIDPNEPGLYGRDSYGTLIDSIDYFDGNLIETIVQTKAWPLFQSYISIVPEITGIGLINISKWIPLITVAVPALVFLFASRLSESVTVAFFVGYSVAVLKTYLSYQTKFVDTSVGFILFVTVLLLWSISSKSKVARYCIVLVSIPLILSHPMVSLFAVSFLLCLYASGKFTKFNNFSLGPLERILPIESGIGHKGLFDLVGFSVLYAFYHFYILSEIPIAALFLPLLTSDSDTGYSTPATVNSPVPNVPSEVLTDYGLLVFVLVMGLLLFFLTISKTRLYDWEFGLEFVIGSLAVYLGITLFIRKVIGFDPSRIWFYLIPILTLVTFNLFFRNPVLSRKNTKKIMIGMILFFALVQSFSMPYQVLYSSPDTTVPYSENNPTIEGQAAVSWGISYDYILFDGLMYENIQNQRSELLHELSHPCPHPIVNREDTVYREVQRHDLSKTDLIYTSGKVQMSACDP